MATMNLLHLVERNLADRAGCLPVLHIESGYRDNAEAPGSR